MSADEEETTQNGNAKITLTFAPDVQHALNQIGESLSAIKKEFSPALSDFVSRLPELGRALSEIVNRLPPVYRYSLVVMAEHGWYLDPAMVLSAPMSIAKALLDGEVGTVDETLSEYFEVRLVEIERHVGELYPKRGAVLASAFGAHRAGQFELSIPVLLAQIDGICHETARARMFGGRREDTKIADYVKSVQGDWLMSLILSPWENPLPINTSKRAANFAELNRHMVLHGESVDYGTRANSLKVISLLNYVATVLNWKRRAD